MHIKYVIDYIFYKFISKTLIIYMRYIHIISYIYQLRIIKEEFSIISYLQ